MVLPAEFECIVFVVATNYLFIFNWKTERWLVVSYIPRLVLRKTYRCFVSVFRIFLFMGVAVQELACRRAISDMNCRPFLHYCVGLLYHSVLENTMIVSWFRVSQLGDMKPPTKITHAAYPVVWEPQNITVQCAAVCDDWRNGIMPDVFVRNVIDTTGFRHVNE